MKARNEFEQDTFPMLESKNEENFNVKIDSSIPSGSDSMRGWAIIASRFYSRYFLFFVDSKWDELDRWVLACTYIIVGCGGSFLIWKLFQVHSEPHVFGWAVAGLCTAIAIPLSIHGIHMHIVHYFSPLQVQERIDCWPRSDLWILLKSQRYYIRILWMVPIYALVPANVSLGWIE